MTAAAQRLDTREAFTLQLSQVVPARELREWFDSAPAWPAPAGEAIYATGVMLPREEAAVAQVRQWIGEGRVDTFVRPDPAEPRRKQYIVRKRAASSQVGGPPERQAPSHACLSDPFLLSLLEQLRGHAEGGSACPSNGELAKRLGLPVATRGQREESRLKVKNALPKLEAAGLLAVERRGTTRPRVVTVLAEGPSQGRSTAK